MMDVDLDQRLAELRPKVKRVIVNCKLEQRAKNEGWLRGWTPRQARIGWTNRKRTTLNVWRTGECVILISRTIERPELIDWAICHELGHSMLFPSEELVTLSTNCRDQQEYIEYPHERICDEIAEKVTGITRKEYDESRVTVLEYEWK
jgi:hypothetical protein